MASGWRNRYLAPVYALVISFLIVLLTGLALPKQEAPKQEAKIHFLVSRTNTPATGLKDISVELIGGDPQTTKINANGEATLQVPNKRFTICATLPGGWTATSRKPSDSPATCWGPFEKVDPQRGIDLHVVGSAG